MIALAGSKSAEKWNVCMPFLWTGIIFMLIAGWAGGVIASTLTQSTSFAEFWTHPAGPFRPRRWMPTGEAWTYLEHTAFWIGIVAVFFAVALA